MFINTQKQIIIILPRGEYYMVLGFVSFGYLMIVTLVRMRFELILLKLLSVIRFCVTLWSTDGKKISAKHFCGTEIDG